MNFDNICVIGTGAIGSVLGGYLSDAGYKVTFIEKDENIIRQVKENGLSISGVREIHLDNVNILPPGSIIEKQDLIFYTVKAYDLEDVLKKSLPIIGEDTYIVCTQNGLGINQIANKYVNNSQIIEGIIWFPAINVKPGHVQLLTFYEQNIFGGYSYKSEEYITKLVSLLNSIGIPARTTEDITYEIWRKAILIITGNSINAITRKNLGIIAKIPQLKESSMVIVQESLNIAMAEGIDLNEDELLRSMDNTLEKGYEHKTSMLIDILNNRKTEIDFLSGKIIELGKKHHIQTPLNLLIYGLIKAIENNI